jgi:hypothetical protein
MSEEAQAAASTLIVDIGKRKRSDVKKLRRGKGKLVSRVQDTIEDLKSSGELDPSAQTVVIIVEKKERKPFRGGFGF